MKWKVAVWSGLAVTLLLGCSSRQEVAHERAPIAIPLEQLSSYWVQEKQWSWLGNDEPALRFVQEDAGATSAKIALARACAVVISAGLGILGVTPAEEMR